MIIISPYNPKWPEEFESIKSSLQAILGDLALRIDHIGSTSVPGLGAKDVIDIQITVKALDDQIRRKLSQAGYQDWGTIAHDHIPQGEKDNPKLWEKFFFNQPEGQRPANIHIRVAGNPNQRYALLFRDYLRAHPNSAKSIELLKREIAKRHGHDGEAYNETKEPAYDLIWDAALEWSRYTDWRPQ